jgi:hypothetical protein
MPCPIMEANKIDRYCRKEEEINPCETCTTKDMDSRISDFQSDLFEAACIRAEEEQNGKVRDARL